MAYIADYTFFHCCFKFLLSQKLYSLSLPTWALHGQEIGILGKSKHILLVGLMDDGALFEK